MKTRCVFSTNDLPAARAAMAAAREAGVDDRDISLVAREDIELAKIPDHLMQGRNDFYPAAVRGGACIGEIVGFEVPDTVSRKFSDEIAAGRILVVIDARREQLDAVEPAVLHTGARELPFHAHTALT